MLLAITVLAFILGVFAVSAITLYATWLLANRLRRGESKAQAFGEWVRNLFEAIWGM
jgi:hypothetical protein